jgi:tetratricopeptide (TPR) repeat protein
MDNSWHLSAQAFASGRLRSARRHLSRVSLSENVSAVQGTSLKVNECAIDLSRAIVSSESMPTSSTHASEALAAKARAYACKLDSTNLAALVFASETALVASYNAALMAWYAGLNSKALIYAKRGMNEATRSALLFLEVCDRIDPSAAPWPVKRPCTRGKKAIERLDLVASGHVTWSNARNACDLLSKKTGDVFEPEVPRALLRWTDAAGSMFELGSAICIICSERELALEAIGVSLSFWSLQASLPVKRAGQVSSTDDQARSADAHMYDDENDSELDSEEGAESCQDDDLKNTQPLQQGDLIPPGARSRCLAAVLSSVDFDYDTAIMNVKCDALAVLDQSCTSFRGSCSLAGLVDELTEREAFYWPNVYLAGAILGLRGESKDRAMAISLLDACTGAGFRVADGTALAARLENEENAIRRWRRVFAIDYARPGALWSAARVFGSLGMQESRTSLLECLLELVTESGDKFIENVTDRGTGIVYLNPPQCASHETFLNPDLIRAERARALSGCGRWAESLDVLDATMSSVFEQGNDVQGTETMSAAEVFGMLRDHAWTLACAGMLDRAKQTSENAILASTSGFGRCSMYLAKADALLNGGEVDKALQAARSSFREAELYQPADGAVDDSSLQFLRGICYNNIGVLEACKGELSQACTSLVAAHVAFDKSAHQCSGDWSAALSAAARRCADSSLFNRTLVLFRRNAWTEGIRLWLEHAGPHVNDWADQTLSGPTLQSLREKCLESETCRSVDVVVPVHVLGKLEESQRAIMSLVCATQATQDAVQAAARSLLAKLAEPNKASSVGA